MINGAATEVLRRSGQPLALATPCRSAIAAWGTTPLWGATSPPPPAHQARLLPADTPPTEPASPREAARPPTPGTPGPAARNARARNPGQPARANPEGARLHRDFACAWGSALSMRRPAPGPAGALSCLRRPWRRRLGRSGGLRLILEPAQEPIGPVLLGVAAEEGDEEQHHAQGGRDSDAADGRDQLDRRAGDELAGQSRQRSQRQPCASRQPSSLSRPAVVGGPARANGRRHHRGVPAR